MNESDYWLECVTTSLEEHGVVASDEQLKAIAADVQGAHDSYGMAFYTPSCDGRDVEIRQLKEALKLERERAEREEGVYAAHIARRFGGTDSVSVRIDHGQVVVEARR